MLRKKQKRKHRQLSLLLIEACKIKGGWMQGMVNKVKAQYDIFIVHMHCVHADSGSTVEHCQQPPYQLTYRQTWATCLTPLFTENISLHEKDSE